jgi:hypothetical protein
VFAVFHLQVLSHSFFIDMSTLSSDGLDGTSKSVIMSTDEKCAMLFRALEHESGIRLIRSFRGRPDKAPFGAGEEASEAQAE